jgi:hypothetical protein
MHRLSEEYLTTSNPLEQIQNCCTQRKELVNEFPIKKNPSARKRTGHSQADDKALVLEGYGLQPVHKPCKISGPLGPEGTNFSFVSILPLLFLLSFPPGICFRPTKPVSLSAAA